MLFETLFMIMYYRSPAICFYDSGESMAVDARHYATASKSFGSALVSNTEHVEDGVSVVLLH